MTQPQGRIGPNAILQLLGPVETHLGPGAMAQLLRQAQTQWPDAHGMIDERDVARVHQTLIQSHPKQARDISQEAGAATARYIRDNRIPRFARIALRHVPRALGERLLTRAIKKHAWTFCGSGRLVVTGGGTPTFAVYDNPVLRGHSADTPQCHWHAAVFSELFSQLLGKPYTTVETKCCAMGASACAFQLSRG